MVEGQKTVKGVKYMVLEGDFTLGEDTMQYTDDVP